ncbi:MAG: Methyltransferase domain-containing protein [Candidatus Electronema aureum]|uniref:Methyltransferase domain-containing protein n=1 Tax=Candidatus Electronema aureum TaxID=2005002 RepID=A0A521G1V0_9BACT|nr:MAG: Methyltransferase domain-containing protein [Candidatus Electronema aureum]
MQEKKVDLLNDVAAYYAEKLAQHGQTPQGVDWNGHESQTIRFEQLCKLIVTDSNFSLNDLGCGYGAFYHFLLSRYQEFLYIGIDVSREMIQAATRHCQRGSQVRFVISSHPDQNADYGMASGIFNVRLEKTNAEWSDYIHSVLDDLHRTSRVGFAFNCLTSYSDTDKKRDYLYYADPCVLFDRCKRLYSKNVSLLHDYGLYEFTIIVKKIL